MNNKVQSFLNVLQSSNQKPYESGSELFKIIFKSNLTEDKNTTLQAEIERYQPEALLWLLDGTLRNIPVAALYDKERKQYLVEKYQNAVFTRARPERFLRKPEPWTDGLGLGISEEERVDIFGDTASGKKGLISGEVLLNADFNRKEMIRALKAKRRAIVHIENHFIFRPGDAKKSYLLLGNNDRFTLTDMRGIPDLFAGVELLILPACETAAQQPNDIGKEIDGFAELAQRLGANSVIATLWNVSAGGASKLMLEFYRLHQEKPDWPKSEVLRQAQLNLLRGKVTDPKAPLELPRYLAPFVLYGSFR